MNFPKKKFSLVSRLANLHIQTLSDLISKNNLDSFVQIMENENISLDLLLPCGTPLIVFLSKDSTKNPFLEYLIKKGAKVNLSDRNGSTALFKACFSGNKQAVEVLLESKEIEIEKEYRQFAFKMNALTVSIHEDHYNIAKMLLHRGADPFKAEVILLSEDQLYRKSYCEKYKKLIDFYKRWHSAKKQILFVYESSNNSQQEISSSQTKHKLISLLPLSIVQKIADEYL